MGAYDAGAEVAGDGSLMRAFLSDAVSSTAPRESAWMMRFFFRELMAMGKNMIPALVLQLLRISDGVAGAFASLACRPASL